MIDQKDVIYDDNDYENKPRIPFYTRFVEQKKDIHRSSSLYTVDGPLQFFHADVAYLIHFLNSAIDPKYALICVDLFSSKVYVYLMIKRSNLSQKLELFYKEIESKRIKNERMRLQTDLEFQQNKIKKLNKKYNVEMFSSKTRGGKAFAAKQKIREFKTLLFNTITQSNKKQNIRFKKTY